MIQRLGRTRKPLAWPNRLTISRSTRARVRFIALWNSGPSVSIELDQKRKGSEQARHQQRAAVAILNVGGMHDRVHQEALRIDKNVPLLALDLLACIVTGRIDAGPPFSALLTLWLSMMAAVGLASREACSRQRV